MVCVAIIQEDRFTGKLNDSICIVPARIVAGPFRLDLRSLDSGNREGGLLGSRARDPKFHIPIKELSRW
jgi:hypothetical protein